MGFNPSNYRERGELAEALKRNKFRAHEAEDVDMFSPAIKDLVNASSRITNFTDVNVHKVKLLRYIMS
jgi:hypothetical protein